MPMSAIEKLRKRQTVKIVQPLPPRVAHWGPPGASMLISTPQEIDDMVRKIPRGKLATINSLRQALARRHGTTITCPVTTGIFMNIVAHAAGEMESNGAQRVTPYWRVLKSDGTLNAKYPGGTTQQKRRLEQEGFAIVAKGSKSLVVEDYEVRLAKL